MKHTLRPLLAFMLFTALLFGGLSALVTVSHGQPGALERPPRGNDKFFKPLPDDGLFEGTVPARSLKTLIMRVPNIGSRNDLPELDLTTNDRLAALGFMLTLEQHVDYLPQLYKEDNAERLRRYQAKLRAPDVPRAGDEESPYAAPSPTLEATLKDWSADLIIAVSFVPGDHARGLAYRYAPGGVEQAVSFELGRFDDDKLTTAFETAVSTLCHDAGAEPDKDGNVTPVPHAPVPRIAVNDRALRTFARMRDAFESGELTEAWLQYDDLMKRDPRCGRAAIYGIEIFRHMAGEQTDEGENLRFNELAVETGINALKHSPNDVYLRGLLCWHAATHLNRFLFAQDGLKQAFRVQPGSFALVKWWATVYEIDDHDKQVEWLVKNALPRIRDGRVELLIADTVFGKGEFQRGIEWYQRGLKVAPRDFELNLGLGMCATHEAERLTRAREPEEAIEMYATAVDALEVCQDVDPQEIMYVYDYYVRAATHSFTRLPTNMNAQDRLFLTQAAVNGLTSSGRTFQWDRLVANVINNQRRIIREIAAEAEPDDPQYVMKLIVRLRFQAIDGDNEAMIETLWQMYDQGLRPALYRDLMTRLAPLVYEHKP